jgi:hypothetical protein
VHHIFRVFQHSRDFLTNGKFQLLDHSWSIRVHSCLEETPQKKSRKPLGQGSARAKKHHRNGRSHVGGTCVELLPLVLLLCELWHHPVGTTFISCLPDTLGVLDAGSCLTC